MELKELNDRGKENNNTLNDPMQSRTGDVMEMLDASSQEQASRAELSTVQPSSGISSMSSSSNIEEINTENQENITNQIGGDLDGLQDGFSSSVGDLSNDITSKLGDHTRELSNIAGSVGDMGAIQQRIYQDMARDRRKPNLDFGHDKDTSGSMSSSEFEKIMATTASNTDSGTSGGVMGAIGAGLGLAGAKAASWWKGDTPDASSKKGTPSGKKPTAPKGKFKFKAGGAKGALLSLGMAGLGYLGVDSLLGDGDEKAMGGTGALSNAVTVEDFKNVGSVSERFESGGRGTATVSSGVGDRGGKSYGKHQLASKTGTVQKYLKQSEYGDQFTGLKAGTKAFDKKWKDLARSDENFGKSQHDFISKTHYKPQLEKLAKGGIDLSGRGKAVKESVFSTSVQFGANTSLIKKALKGQDVDSMSDSDVISAIQDYKTENNARLFRSSSASTRKSTLKRSHQEKAMLLALNEQDKQQQKELKQTPEPSMGTVVTPDEDYGFKAGPSVAGTQTQEQLRSEEGGFDTDSLAAGVVVLGSAGMAVGTGVVANNALQKVTGAFGEKLPEDPDVTNKKGKLSGKAKVSDLVSSGKAKLVQGTEAVKSSGMYKNLKEGAGSVKGKVLASNAYKSVSDISSVSDIKKVASTAGSSIKATAESVKSSKVGDVLSKTIKEASKKSAEHASEVAAAKAVAKTTVAAAKTGAAKLAKLGAKAVPGLGIAINVYDAGSILLDEEASEKDKAVAMGGMSAGMAGAAAGAAALSFIPGVGTIVGGLAGYMLGNYLGSTTVEAVLEDSEEDDIFGFDSEEEEAVSSPEEVKKVASDVAKIDQDQSVVGNNEDTISELNNLPPPSAGVSDFSKVASPVADVSSPAPFVDYAYEEMKANMEANKTQLAKDRETQESKLANLNLKTTIPVYTLPTIDKYTPKGQAKVTFSSTRRESRNTEAGLDKQQTTLDRMSSLFGVADSTGDKVSVRAEGTNVSGIRKVSDSIPRLSSGVGIPAIDAPSLVDTSTPAVQAIDVIQSLFGSVPGVSKAMQTTKDAVTLPQRKAGEGISGINKVTGGLNTAVSRSLSKPYDAVDALANKGFDKVSDFKMQGTSALAGLGGYAANAYDSNPVIQESNRMMDVMQTLQKVTTLAPTRGDVVRSDVLDKIDKNFLSFSGITNTASSALKSTGLGSALGAMTGQAQNVYSDVSNSPEFNSMQSGVIDFTSSRPSDTVTSSIRTKRQAEDVTRATHNPTKDVTVTNQPNNSANPHRADPIKRKKVVSNDRQTTSQSFKPVLSDTPIMVNDIGITLINIGHI